MGISSPSRAQQPVAGRSQASNTPPAVPQTPVAHSITAITNTVASPTEKKPHLVEIDAPSTGTGDATNFLDTLPPEMREEIYGKLNNLDDFISVANLGKGHRDEVLRVVHNLDEQKKTELWHTAVFSDVHEAVQFCLDSNIGADIVNATTNNGRTALWRAAVNGNKEMVKMLLKHPGIDPNVVAERDEQGTDTITKAGYTALIAAIFKDNVEVVTELLKHPAINPNLGMPLSVAVAGRNIDIVKALLEAPDTIINLDASDPSMRAVTLFYYHERQESVGWTALYEAADSYFDLTAVVTELLNHPGIDPNLGAPLVAAATRGKCATVKVLLRDPHINVNMPDPFSHDSADFYTHNYRYTALWRATCNGHTEVVNELLKHPGISSPTIGNLLADPDHKVAEALLQAMSANLARRHQTSSD